MVRLRLASKWSYLDLRVTQFVAIQIISDNIYRNLIHLGFNEFDAYGPVRSGGPVAAALPGGC